MLSPLARRVVDAYGGEERWRSAQAVHCMISAHGFAFLSKMRRGIRDVRFEAQVWEPKITMHPLDRRGSRAVFEGGSVRVEDAAGKVVASRAEPRRHFPYGRRSFWWDRLDAAYFSSYASWNYLTLPALLLRDDIEWTQLSETSLQARFPPRLPTHCELQRFHFYPETALLRQHDYTAEVFGGWAKAANVVLEHGSWEGIPYPSRRRVTPRRPDGRPRAFPLLVGIRITDWGLF